MTTTLPGMVSTAGQWLRGLPYQHPYGLTSDLVIQSILMLMWTAASATVAQYKYADYYYYYYHYTMCIATFDKQIVKRWRVSISR